MSHDVDVLVIGAGHNGLVAAGTLARRGLDVLVLEQEEAAGGLSGTRELRPGLRVPTGAVDLGGLRSTIVEELDLAAHGLELEQPSILGFVPALDGRPPLSLFADVATARRALAVHFPEDAERLPLWLTQLADDVESLEPLLTRHADGESLGELAVRPRLLRAASASAAWRLRDGLRCQALHALLGWRAVLGARCGPEASGTGLGLLLASHGVSAERFPSRARPRGGMGRFVAALTSSLEAAGGRFRTGAPVERILVEDGRAIGVRLEGGEELRARLVLSNAPPRRTLLGLVGSERLPPETVRALLAAKYRGTVARVDLLLDERPRFVGLEDDSEIAGEVVVASGLGELERAADDTRYGRLAERPCLVATLPADADPTLAGDAGQALSVTVLGVPHTLDTEQDREQVVERVLARLEEVSPGLRGHVLDHDLTLPADWDRRGWSEGNVMHGESGLWQSFVLRPVASGWGYRTPVDGLLLCGVGTHPGGGVTGLPGRIAAEVALDAL